MVHRIRLFTHRGMDSNLGGGWSACWPGGGRLARQSSRGSGARPRSLPHTLSVWWFTDAVTTLKALGEQSQYNIARGRLQHSAKHTCQTPPQRARRFYSSLPQPPPGPVCSLSPACVWSVLLMHGPISMLAPLAVHLQVSDSSAIQPWPGYQAPWKS